MRKKFTSRVAAVIGVATLATVGVVGVASAADPVFPPVSDIDPGQNGQGSLTIHKFEGSPAGVENDGVELDPGDFPDDFTPVPLPGVTFRLCTVVGDDLDVESEPDWQNISDLNDYVVEHGELDTTLTTDCTLVNEQTTDGDGEALWSNLPFGVYFVEEVSAPAGVAESWPFLVTIPLPTNAAGAGDNGWIYDVHVYPKNAMATLDMSVTDIGQAALGADVPWTVSTTLPYLQFGPLSFTIDATIDPSLAYVENSVVVKHNGSVLDPSYYIVTESGGTLTVTFNDVGEDNFPGFDSRDTIEVTYETTVLALGDTGIIPASATMEIRDRPGAIAAAGTPPTSNWGAVEIFKHDEADNTDGLPGATFQVFADAAAARACITATATADPCVNALRVWDGTAYIDTFVTNGDGEVIIPGLNVGIDSGAIRTYYLAETVAPDGYLLLFQPIEIDVTPNGNTVTSPADRAPIANVAESPITLPNTGAQGTLLLLVGAGLLGAGALALFASNKRKADKKG